MSSAVSLVSAMDKVQIGRTPPPPSEPRRDAVPPLPYGRGSEGEGASPAMTYLFLYRCFLPRCGDNSGEPGEILDEFDVQPGSCRFQDSFHTRGAVVGEFHEEPSTGFEDFGRLGDNAAV